jgi:hypothetical protein
MPGSLEANALATLLGTVGVFLKGRIVDRGGDHPPIMGCVGILMRAATAR